MESKRQQKFGKLIQKDISAILQKETSDLVQGSLVTISIVKMTPDLGVAKVYASVFPEADHPRVIGLLNENVSRIRNYLGRKIKNQVRKVPELQFFFDDMNVESAKVEKLFDNLHIPPAEEE